MQTWISHFLNSILFPPFCLSPMFSSIHLCPLTSLFFVRWEREMWKHFFAFICCAKSLPPFLTPFFSREKRRNRLGLAVHTHTHQINCGLSQIRMDGRAHRRFRSFLLSVDKGRAPNSSLLLPKEIPFRQIKERFEASVVRNNR